jgi:hypothetical protein
MQQEVEKVMEALLQAHVFPDRLTLQREAFRALLMLRPELRIEGAVILYRQGEVSFARSRAVRPCARGTQANPGRAGDLP